MKKAAKPAHPGASSSAGPAKPGKPVGKPVKPVKPVKHVKPPQAHSQRKTSRLMHALGTPFRFVSGLFMHELQLERDGKNLNIKLASKTGAQQPAAAPPSPAELELKLMRAELKKLLDVHPGTRHLMRHLVYVERALQDQGLQALIEIPEEVLSTALEQLEKLVSNWSNRELATLRSKMSVAALNRSRDPFYGTTGHKASAFHTESRLQVGDATHSMFLELERQYKELVPSEVLQSVKSDFAPLPAPAP